MASELVYYSKSDCPLCEKGHALAVDLAAKHGLNLRCQAIDSDPALVERYALKVPALLYEGILVGWGRLSERALERDFLRAVSESQADRPADAEQLTAESLGEARARYFRETGLPVDGGYSDRWVRLVFAGIPIAFPNTQGRVRAVRIHDLHHALTGYRTDWPGEAEISAWEIATHCRDFFAAWALNLVAMSVGLVVSPARTYRAFIRGRHSENLYGRVYDDALLQLDFEGVRRECGLGRPQPEASLPDRLAFAGASLAAVGSALGVLAPVGFAVAGIVSLLRSSLP